MRSTEMACFYSATLAWNPTAVDNLGPELDVIVDFTFSDPALTVTRMDTWPMPTPMVTGSSSPMAG